MFGRKGQRADPKHGAVTAKAALLVAVAVAGVCLAFVLSPAGAMLDNQLMIPLQYRLSSWLEKDPSLDSRIKIIALDDDSAADLKASDLRLSQWHKLIATIDSQKPRAIIIDKLFGFEDYRYGTRASRRKAESRLKRIKSPLFAGAYVAPQELDARSPLPLNRREYDLSRLLHRSIPRDRALATLRHMPIPQEKSKHIYGPYARLQKVFDHIGHINYDGDGRIQPLLRVNEKTAVPHIGIYASPDLYLYGGGIVSAGKLIPTDQQGKVLVDLAPFDSYHKHVRPMHQLLSRQSRSKVRKYVSPGDIVFLVPMYYTGNTDFKPTPQGMMPSAFVHVGFINSLLSGRWIREPVPSSAVIVGAVLLGALYAMKLSYLLIALSLALLNLGIFGLTVFAFAEMRILLPWFWFVLPHSLTVVMLYLMRHRVDESKVRMLKHALDGVVASDTLRGFLKRPDKISLEAREQVVTVMFIDVVGYSLLAENQVPRVAFDQLKYLLRDISKEIHKYGGMVNKTLGDGLLCLFGYEFDTGNVSADHAEKAVACAIKIQEKNLRMNLRAFQRSEPVYPLRIGVHTASVFLGDLGTEDRIDFTAIGNGVNYAKRMEAACEIHSVLFSSTTKDLVATLSLDSDGLSKRMISIKHRTNLIEAYEYDPFFRHPELRERSIEAYRQCASLARMEQRYSVNFPDLIYVKSSVGSGSLINYSPTGISIKIKSKLQKGSEVVLRLDSIDNRLGRQLAEAGIEEIRAEVRWVYSESDGHVHGVLFRDCSEEKGLRLVDIVKFYDMQAKASRPGSKIA